MVVEATRPESSVTRRSYLRWLSLLALGLFALLPPPSLTTAPDGAASLEPTVAMLERDLMRAVQSRDRARLDALIAPDCELTGSDSSGERVGKHAYVAAALDPAQVTLDEFRFEDLATTSVAADVAIVRATLARRGRERGRPTNDRLLLTDVWKRRSGRWQLVSRHASAVR